MTSQIDWLGKTSHVLRVSTYIYGVYKYINGKTLIFQINLGLWPLKLIILEKCSLFWGFQHTFMGFLRRDMEIVHLYSKPRPVTPQIDWLGKTSPVLRGFNIPLWDFYGDRWENVQLSRKLRPVTPQSDCLRKSSPVPTVITHIYRISQEIDGKSFICWGKLGMCPLKLIVLENHALFWRFQHTFMRFLRRDMGKHSFLG